MYDQSLPISSSLSPKRQVSALAMAFVSVMEEFTREMSLPMEGPVSQENFLESHEEFQRRFELVELEFQGLSLEERAAAYSELVARATKGGILNRTAASVISFFHIVTRHGIKDVRLVLDSSVREQLHTALLHLGEVASGEISIFDEWLLPLLGQFSDEVLCAEPMISSLAESLLRDQAAGRCSLCFVRDHCFAALGKERGAYFWNVLIVRPEMRERSFLIELEKIKDTPSPVTLYRNIELLGAAGLIEDPRYVEAVTEFLDRGIDAGEIFQVYNALCFYPRSTENLKQFITPVAEAIAVREMRVKKCVFKVLAGSDSKPNYWAIDPVLRVCGFGALLRDPVFLSAVERAALREMSALDQVESAGSRENDILRNLDTLKDLATPVLRAQLEETVPFSRISGPFKFFSEREMINPISWRLVLDSCQMDIDAGRIEKVADRIRMLDETARAVKTDYDFAAGCNFSDRWIKVRLLEARLEGSAELEIEALQRIIRGISACASGDEFPFEEIRMRDPQIITPEKSLELATAEWPQGVEDIFKRPAPLTRTIELRLDPRSSLFIPTIGRLAALEACLGNAEAATALKRLTDSLEALDKFERDDPEKVCPIIYERYRDPSAATVLGIDADALEWWTQKLVDDVIQARNMSAMLQQLSELEELGDDDFPENEDFRE